MSTEQKEYEVFRSGATWLRADFHLHTKADKEFKYSDSEDYYFSNYVEGLEKAQIRLGVIANHNKFDTAEFKSLKKTASKKEICLLPGVELSVNDGSNGVHTLIVFSDQWLENGNDYISPFITTMFPGKAESEYQNENGRSDKNILQVVEELEKTGRDYFLIFAHVEQKSGLWYEMGGGKLGDFKNKRYETVRSRTLGFQKVRTHDKSDKVCRTKIKDWLGGWYPAELEGSDCKSIEDIGNEKSCYLKLGAFSFDAVKFALVDKDSRVATDPVQHGHSRIQNIRFIGGTLAGKQIHFSPELNTMIGIRGSGKSSILEVIRYVLEIPVGEKSGDKKYKEGLVKYTMGSGGKIEMDVVDRHGKAYTISKVYGEDTSVEDSGQLLQGVAIRESILRKPIYFGQKDLSSTGEGFEKDLVNKLLGSKRDEVLQKISTQKVKVIDAVRNLISGLELDDQIKEQNDIMKDADHQLKFYADHKVEEKLQKRLDFDSDVKQIDATIDAIDRFSQDISNISTGHESTLSSQKDYVSKHNAELFEKLKTILETKYLSLIAQLKVWEQDNPAVQKQLTDLQTEMKAIRKGMVDEFAEIERKLSEELKEAGNTNISSEEFLALKTKRSKAVTRIDELQKQKNEFVGYQETLLKEVKALNDLWHEEFLLIKSELEKIEKESSSITIDSNYKGDKAHFVDTMKEYCKGSGLRDTTFQGIASQYSDFASIYKDMETAKQYFGSNPQLFTDRFLANLESALTYQVPNKFIIKYRGKELQHHSLGQRASALILFVLSLKENDVIIIDQPEDDLDNQTIYEDVIKLIRDMKPGVQFIFATHNPNIPVLGDAELVHACSFMDEKVTVQSGSVDAQDTQKTIVNIMEGGQEAFNRRKEIYKIWKP
ncbi:AAA family ATPase [Akkermansia sp. N21116]|mgnify:CR=1 FL=1|uniref:TrlF family AAA-like ATPase n=1 Tax=Akkermansia sp. N21116 TaxID=3040764 RepID=UPI00244EBA36|nr:AAA family ATPase [Akkermansia sp. N21116]WPX40859.1 AAA family ATPase [Akkermansia sp. N21116]